jgi:CBS domain-containing protein
MAKKVSDAMTPRPRAIRPDASIQEAAGAMEIEDVGSIPLVEDDGRLVGIVTDRDITIRTVARGRDPRTTPVAEAASTAPVVIGPEDDLDAAMTLMAQHQLRRLPVVEGDTLVGMVALADVSRAAREKDVGEVVEVISQPNAGPRIDVEDSTATTPSGGTEP